MIFIMKSKILKIHLMTFLFKLSPLFKLLDNHKKMTRINSILQTPLFTSEKMRTYLIEAIEIAFSSKLGTERNIYNFPFSFFQSNSELEKVIVSVFTSMGFEHTANDKVLQNLIILFLIYSKQKYSVNQELIDFINSATEEEKIAEIEEGVKKVWCEYQNQIITNLLVTDKINLVRNPPHVEQDDFPF